MIDLVVHGNCCDGTMCYAILRLFECMYNKEK